MKPEEWLDLINKYIDTPDEVSSDDLVLMATDILVLAKRMKGLEPADKTPSEKSKPRSNAELKKAIVDIIKAYPESSKEGIMLALIRWHNSRPTSGVVTNALSDLRRGNHIRNIGTRAKPKWVIY